MPLITQASSTFSYLTGVPPVPPTPITFPKDSVVPYYGSSAPGNGWELYPAADGKFLTGTTSSSLFGTSTTTTNAIGTATLNSTGAHVGSVSYISAASATAGSTVTNSLNSSAGAHAHAGTLSFAANQFNNTPSIMPPHTSVMLIRASTEVNTIPENTVAFRNASYGTKFGSSTRATYFRGGYPNGAINNIDPGVTSSTAYSASTTQGSHRHHGNTQQYYITGKLTNYPGVDSGNHTHNLTATLTQTLMNSTILLDAWSSATSRSPAKDVIVMYVGNPTNLPENWFLCNGNNGTINMDSYYVAAAPSGTSNWGTVKSSDAAISNLIVGSIGSHSHIGTTSPAGAGRTAWHGSQAWSHTHASVAGVIPMAGAKYYIYFIQYKG